MPVLDFKPTPYNVVNLFTKFLEDHWSVFIYSSKPYFLADLHAAHNYRYQYPILARIALNEQMLHFFRPRVAGDEYGLSSDRAIFVVGLDNPNLLVHMRNFIAARPYQG